MDSSEISAVEKDSIFLIHLLQHIYKVPEIMVLVVLSVIFLVEQLKFVNPMWADVQ